MSIIGDNPTCTPTQTDTSKSPNFDCTFTPSTAYKRPAAQCCKFTQKNNCTGKVDSLQCTDAAFKCGTADTTGQCTSNSKVWYPTVVNGGTVSYLKSSDNVTGPLSLQCCPAPAAPEYVYQLGPWAAVKPSSS